MRFVLDADVLVSALLSKHGAPARLITHWLELLAELIQTLGYPRLRERVPAEDATEFVELLRSAASIAKDRSKPPPVSADPDDYLIALATTSASILVSGDRHLLALAPGLPIHSPAAALALLES